ncbi:alpha/beta fold hydrolase [Myxococcota bacterium]|nr:alpha/beta fold hydrolase [Myxococcota bacterium]
MPLDAFRLTERAVGLRTFASAVPGPGVPELVCLPPVGGYSMTFRSLARSLAGRAAVTAVDPPGHGASRGEPLDSVDAMADAYLDALGAERLSRAYLLGHSLGGFVAAAMTARLERAGLAPRGLVVCGTAPHPKRALQRPMSKLDDDGLLAALVELGGIAPEIAREREVFDLFKRTIRVDLVAYESADALEAPLATRALVLLAERDGLVLPEWLDDWRHHLADAELERVRGGHFFVVEEAQALAARVLRFFR